MKACLPKNHPGFSLGGLCFDNQEGLMPLLGGGGILGHPALGRPFPLLDSHDLIRLVVQRLSCNTLNAVLWGWAQCPPACTARLIEEPAEHSVKNQHVLFL